MVDDTTISDGEVFKAGRVAISARRRTITIFLIPLLATLVLLYTGDAIAKHILHQRMVQYNYGVACRYYGEEKGRKRYDRTQHGAYKH